MARRKQHWLVALLLGKPKKSRRSSSGRRKSGSNPVNVARKYQRWATTVNSNRAASVKERNDLRDKNAKARVQLDQEIARKKRAKAAQKKARDDARAARVKSAASRRVNPNQQPTVTVTSTTRRPGESRERFIQRGRDEATAAARRKVATQRKSTPAEVASASKCGAPCDDGTTCNNPSLGETCAAGHNPTNAKAKRKPSYRDNWNRTRQQPGETTDDFLRRERFERSGGQFLRDQQKERAGQSTFQQDREAKNRRDGMVECRCCGSYHGRQMASGEHCSGCKGHARAKARA